MATATQHNTLPAYPFVVTPSMEVDDEPYLIVVVPDLPGCMTHIEPGADLIARVQGAIDAWVSFAEEEGMVVPTPGSSSQSLPDWARASVFPTLSTADVARQLNVTPRRVRALAQHRGVGRVVGSSLMFFPDEIQKLIPGRVGRPRAVASQGSR